MMPASGLEWLKSFLHNLLQNILLAIPALSEARLGAHKVMAFLRIWHYIARANVQGDYFEFGVYEGMSFKLSIRAAGKFFGANSPIRFFAFDSFQGLPEPESSRDAGGVFRAGEYHATQEQFRGRIQGASRGREVVVVPGFFQESLTADLVRRHSISKAAFVSIDCDLYQSTLQALRFMTPFLQNGTVLYFDDWFFSHGNLKLGEAGACQEWLRENPRIRLIDFETVGIMGKAFLVNLN